MELNKACPRCGSVAKKVSKTYICQCGWTLNVDTESKKSQARTAVALLCSASFLTVTFFHFFQWGGHGFSILFADSVKKVAICSELRKYDCVEKAYYASFNKTGDLKYLEELGEMQFKREKYSESEGTYKLYFAKGGDSFKAAYYYAHILSKNNQVDSAIQYFDTILRSKPHALMITVMDSYIDILISHRRGDKAKEVLSWVKKTNPGATNIQSDLERWESKIKNI